MTLVQWILTYDERHNGGFTKRFVSVRQWEAEYELFKAELERFRASK